MRLSTSSLSLFSALFLASLASVALAPTVGCTPSAGEDTESAEQMNTAEDLALAKEVVAILGGENGKCKNCHGINPARVRTWGTAMKTVQDACFAPAALTPTERVNCLRSVPTNPASPFSARRLGLYATGVPETSSAQFKDLFDDAFPPATASAEYVAFAQKAAMPRGGAALTAAEFTKLKGWVLRGMPQLDEAFANTSDAGPGDGGGDAGPTAVCTPKTTPELAAHITAMKTSGWGARLADQSTPMFGCNGAAGPIECMGNLPDATVTFGAPNVTQKLRRLRKQPLSSHYWVRSSSDGRYVGYGMNSSAKIIDLTKPESNPGIKIAADYDPFFLAGNDGFAFAGAHTGNSIRVCRQSLLADVAGQASPSITLTENKCTSIGQQVYQSIGSSLDGGKYFVTWGAHENDDGGNSITSPLPAAFGNNATTIFTPMVNDGQAYRAQPTIPVVLPREGDAMLSPSSTLAAMRFGNGQKAYGYRIRFIKSQQVPVGDGGAADAGTTTSITTTLGAEVCMPGQKAGFSFDERFMVTHQYVDHVEPDQVDLPESSANIMLADLVTGKQYRITSSKKNIYALYPHFRADGWLYFIVRDMDQNQEYVVASDIAIRIENAQN
jgi:hypothetical protein